jgi:hypothetical protein
MKRHHRTQRPNRCERGDLPVILHHPPHRPYPTITATNHKAKHKHELELLQDLWHLFKERRVLGFFARRTPRHVDTEHVTRDRLQNMHGDAAEEAVLSASQKLPAVTSHQTHFSKLRESGRTGFPMDPKLAPTAFFLCGPSSHPNLALRSVNCFLYWP